MAHIPFCGCKDCDGERGERGRRGKRGERGEHGERGERGRRGRRGPHGHDGDPGSTGPTGPTGLTGATGATGPTGSFVLTEGSWAMKWSGRVDAGEIPQLVALADDITSSTLDENRYPFCTQHTATCLIVRAQINTFSSLFGPAIVQLEKNGVVIVGTIAVPPTGTTSVPLMLLGAAAVFAPGDDIQVRVIAPSGSGTVAVEVVVEFLGPAGATGATGPSAGSSGVADLIAAAVVNGDGTFGPPSSHPGFSAVSQVGTGVYRLTLTDFPANPDNLIVNATIVGVLLGGQITWHSILGNMIEVSTFDAAGNPADRNFTITAFDTTP